MRFIACHNGKLQHLAEASLKSSADRTFRTGLAEIDNLAPGKAFMRGAVHELLTAPSDGDALFFAALLARFSSREINRDGSYLMSSSRGMGVSPMHSPIIWCDPNADLYPPALIQLGIDLSNVYLLHPKTLADETWAIAECLRCKGVGAVIAAPRRLSRIEARRLQLAAETGGSVGILMRHTGPGSSIYAAATRWLVAPAPGERTVQRWKIQLLHGHGGRIGSSVFLENCRETHTVHAVEKLADRAPQTPAASRATA